MTYKLNYTNIASESFGAIISTQANPTTFNEMQTPIWRIERENQSNFHANQGYEFLITS